MFLMRERDIRQCWGDRKLVPVIAGTASECSFIIDASGKCKAEFHSNHVENLEAQNGRYAVPQKYAFVFRATFNICGCHIPIEVLNCYLYTF